MVSSDDELELLLSEAGNRLLDPPSSIDELLPLLDKAEGLLSRVEQSPSELIQDTLPSFVKALMADELFTHSDEEVKVAVASCISEITRITAPDAPYEDDQMKDVFRLIVSSFENLHDKSSRSYAKRTSILETVARVRSCVVMLDLECDDLILEMFQHFLKSIREYHHKNVFESMVTIMTLIIEESEDVSPDLLSCLLAYVKKDKKEVSPISQALVENVLKNCASALKPCLVEMLQSLGSTVDDYCDAVRSIFQDVWAVGMNHNHATGEHKVDKRAPRINPASRSLKLRITNVVVQKKEVDSVSTKEERRNQSSQSKSNTTLGPGNARGVDSDDAANLESLRVNRKRKGRQFAGSLISRKKETKKLLANNKEHDNGNLDDELPSEGKKKAPGKTLPKAEGRENLSTVSGSKNMGELVGNQLKKRGRKKKREDSKEVVRDGAELSEKELEEISDSEAKAKLRSCTKVSAGDSVNSKSAITLKIGRNITDVSGEAEEKHGKSSLKKVNESNNLEEGSSIKKQKNKKQLSSEKETTEDGVEKSVVKEKKKVVSSSPKPFSKFNKDKQRPSDTTKTNNKGKRTPGKKSSDVKAYGAELIGLPIRVWWPQDHQFYEGIVDSFDSGKKKHKVVYNDGDQEMLNLQKEKWEFVKEPTGSYQDEAPNDGSADASPELPLKKRVKGGMEESAAKEGKKEVMTKKGGDTSSGKGKAMALKSGKRTGVGGKSSGKSGKNSKNKSKDPPVLNGKKSAAASNNAYESDDSKEKATDLDEPKDDDLLCLKASIKSKGRAGKTKKDSNVSSLEDVSKNGGELEKMDSDGLVNQKENEPNTAEVEDVNEKEDASGRDRANEDESSGPEQGTESKTGKKRARVA